MKGKPNSRWGLKQRREREQLVWVEIEGLWELNRGKEDETLVWEGEEMSLGLIGDDDQASATTASKSDDEQAKATSMENDLAATANDSVRSSRMGIVTNGDRHKWVR